MKFHDGDPLADAFRVALLVSAWIEIINGFPMIAIKFVALLVSAWIEIPVLTAPGCVKSGRTPRECVD